MSKHLYLVPKFYKEDLRYGFKPITLFSKWIKLGGGPIILGKQSGKFYQLGSGHLEGFNVIEEYDGFIKNKKSGFDWRPLEINIKK